MNPRPMTHDDMEAILDEVFRVVFARQHVWHV